MKQSLSALLRIFCGQLPGAGSGAGAAVLLLEGRLQLLSLRAAVVVRKHLSCGG